ncbi:hypothetical protein ACHAQA_002940 [Verticillium albo-atrum]
MSTNVVLITGANTGIGLAVARQLAALPNYHVIIGSRSAEAGSAAADALKADGLLVSSVQLDLTSDDSINAAAAHIESSHGRLDVLVNNAGVLLDVAAAHSGLPTRDLYNQTFGPNVIGTACVTDAMLPLLRKAALPRIVFVSSRMGSLAESLNENTMYYATDYKVYDASKAAVNLLAIEYARILKDVGGKSNAVCPGLVSTKLTGFTAYGTTTEVGAKRIVEVVLSGKDGPTGTFSDQNGAIAW